ncbi:O-methyltransferase [Candidatus Coxiella mudrowiae]|uniref:O-methyltransferase n=1 Tax=Candidatus Coxiella mudrowiae TaxID=2054173 RepID=UPI001FD10B6C|nr:class I SAM-dependent methyltransferase [Candidatus Coxiella mudrowiae]
MMSINTTFLTPSLYDYFLEVSLRESLILRELRKETTRLFPTYKIQTAPEQAQLLALLVKLVRAQKIIEVGTFAGYVTMAMAQALPPNGKIITCDVNEKTTNLARQYWQKAGLSNRIELRLAPASETLAQLIHTKQTNQYEFIYIDADKPNMNLYYEESLKLLCSGGVIALDNVLWQGKVANKLDQSESTQAIRALNQKIYQDKRVEISLIPIGDGLTLAKKI